MSDDCSMTSPAKHRTGAAQHEGLGRALGSFGELRVGPGLGGGLGSRPRASESARRVYLGMGGSDAPPPPACLKHLATTRNVRQINSSALAAPSACLYSLASSEQHSGGCGIAPRAVDELTCRLGWALSAGSAGGTRSLWITITNSLP
jgi:hypothetical protein